MPDDPADNSLGPFLRRWCLNQLDNWELPVLEGSNLSGLARPESASAGLDTTHWEVPITARLSDRYPLRQILKEVRRTQTPEHLRELQEALDDEHHIGLVR